jgi:ketosteroid isomerase-like protein
VSGENVEIVVGQFESVNAGDPDAIPLVWADDVTLMLHGDLRAGGGEGATGKPAVQKWFGDWFARFSEYEFRVEEVRDLGARVFLVATHVGRGRSSGVPVSFQTSYVYHLEDGLTRRIDVWGDRAEALAAAGVEE